jgi:hypothetical protein
MIPQRLPRVSPALLLAVAMLSSGGALVSALVLKWSLAVTLPSLGCCAGTVSVLTWRRVGESQRRQLKRHLHVGLLAGLLGTLGYDLARYAVVWIVEWHVNPLKAVPLFGQLLLGPRAPALATWCAGAAYHLLNGVAFAVAYVLILGGRGWLGGILWALGLEAAMLTLYPGWLDLRSTVLKEFTVMSVTGHVVYGALIGISSQRLLRSTV